MEYIISFLAGSFFKMVDEIEDTENHIFEGYKDYIQTLCTAFLSIWLYNDVFVSLIHILIILPACMYVNQVDTLYWKTLLPLPFITFLFNAHSLVNIDIYEILQVSLVFITTIVCIILESYMFPEETSTLKTNTRITFLFIVIALVFLIETYIKNVRFVKFTKSLFIFGIGYISVSIVSKLFPFTQPASLIKSEPSTTV
jgi:hypothetical protein